MSDPGRGARRLAFERLSLRRMPGFEAGGFTLDSLSPGVNVIHGPNASGKTTTGRAIRGLLWPATVAGEASLAATLDLEGERWEIDVDRDRVRHRRDGAPSAPPPLPPADGADRYGLALHELLQEEARGEDLAAAVAREAAGGYDLEAAREAVGARPRPSHPQKRRAEYEAALARVREVDDEQRRIASEAADLARLEGELEAAREARVRLGRLEAALELAACRERAALAEAERAAFPPAAARLTGQEAERLADLTERLTAATEARERAGAAMAQEERRLATVRLPAAGVAAGRIEELGDRREHLARLEQEIERREGELAAARRRREEAKGELGPSADDERLAAFRPGDWKAVLDLAQRADGLHTERIELDALDGWVGEAAAPDEIDRRLAELAAEARLLRDWLAEPAAGWRQRVPALLAALLLAAAAVAGGLRVHPGLWGLAGAALLIVAWCWRDVDREARERASLEERYARLPAAEPLAWRRDVVTLRLEDLDARTAAARAERLQALRRPELVVRRHRWQADAAALDAERRQTLAAVGVASGLEAREPAPLAAWVHSLARWRQAHDDLGGAEAALEVARGRWQAVLESVCRELAPFGAREEDPSLFDVSDAASARGAIDDLERRAQEHRRATEALDRLAGERGELARAEAEIARAESGRGELFSRLGLEDGDERGLIRLLDQRDAYLAAEESCRGAAIGLRRAEEALGADDELREAGPLALEAERAEAAAAAQRLEELADRLGRLRERVARAKVQHDLEDALARREAAEVALREERGRDADAVVAWALAGWVRERTRGTRRPAVMARATELFARISGGAFRLLDPVGDPPVFRAEDTRAGVSRDLAELSAGRRLQLLAAVRMGFVEEQERGVRVPLVMDETLANSDDAAAEALIGAVIELAREGRQVFYLTAQDDEVAKWRAALEAAGEAPPWRVIDLVDVRELERERRAPRREWRPARPEVPEPGDLGRGEYGERLGVPGLDPRADAGAVHLWYLVDEVAVLHRLLQRGLSAWGELRALTADAGAALLGDGADGERLEARVAARGRCLQVLYRAWRSGRGRPVDRAVLAASGAVSDRFLDEVSDLAERLGGNAGALVAAIEEGEVKGFRSDKTDQLAAYLREAGHLDDRSTPSTPELRELVLAEMATEIEAGELTLGAVDELLAQMPG